MLPDELKNMWQEYAKLQVVHNRLNPDAIRRALKEEVAEQSKSLQRSILFDLGIALLIAIPLLLLRKQLLEPPLQSVFVALFAVALAASLLLLPFKYAALKIDVHNAQNLKNGLRIAIRRFERLIFAYFTMSLLSPLLGFALACKIYLGTYVPSPPSAYLGTLFLVLAITVAWFAFTRWYVERLYGKHLHQLKNSYEQLITGNE